MEGDVRWHHGQTLAAGQVAEFKVWAELVRQSAGGLHVFLPLRDVGIDAVLHRLADGAYFPIQVKGRTSLTPERQVHVTVTASSLVDDDALMLCTLIDGPDLGAYVLVVAEADFRRLAAHDIIDGREYLTAAFELHAEGGSRWAPYLVRRDELAARFGVIVAAETLDRTAVVDRAAEGFLGEAEVIRRLAEADSLALFRPFPDLETVEVLSLNVKSGHFLGLQVKTAGYEEMSPESRVYFRISSFRASDTTHVCVLGWDRARGAFAESCLLMPSAAIPGIARAEGDWMVLELEPGSESHRRLDRYRMPLGGLAERVATLAGSRS